MSRQGCMILWSLGNPAQVQTEEVGRNLRSAILQHPTLGITEPRLSPNGKWIVFRVGADLHYAPFHGDQPIGEKEWVKLAGRAGYPFWSPGGRNLYYAALHEEGSDQMVVLRQPFDPATGRLNRAAVAFYSLKGLILGSPIVNQVIGAPGGVVLGLMEESSDIWVQDLVKH